MKRGLIPFALASLLAAQANAFELKSPDISAQRPIAEKIRLQFLRLQRRERLAGAGMDRPAGRDQGLRGAGSRPRRSDWRRRLLALDRDGHSPPPRAASRKAPGRPTARPCPPARNNSTATSADQAGAAPARRPDMAHIIIISRFTRCPRNIGPARERANGLHRLHRQQQGAGQGDADRDLRSLKSRRRRRYVIDAAGSSYRGGVRLPAGAAGAGRPPLMSIGDSDRRARHGAQSRPARRRGGCSRRAGHSASANCLFLHRVGASADPAGPAFRRDPAGPPRLHAAGAALPLRACR